MSNSVLKKDAFESVCNSCVRINNERFVLQHRRHIWIIKHILHWNYEGILIAEKCVFVCFSTEPFGINKNFDENNWNFWTSAIEAKTAWILFITKWTEWTTCVWLCVWYVSADISYLSFLISMCVSLQTAKGEVMLSCLKQWSP